MRIRSKLLIALTLIAVAPLLVAAVVGQLSTRSLGFGIAERSAQEAIDQATGQLRQITRDQAMILRARSLALLLAIELQAEGVRDALASPPPVDAEPRFAREDFDDGRNPPDDLHADNRYTTLRDGKPVPLPVSFSSQAFVGATGLDARTLETQSRQLTALSDVYQSLRALNPELVYWQYTTTAQGVHAGYPGHGGYPEDFSPRQRTWYTQAVRVRKPVWGPPIVDASTRQTMLTLSTPVEDSDGRLLGVTGLDVRIRDLVDGLTIPEAWGADAEVFVTSFHDWVSNAPSPSPLIYAQRSYERDDKAVRAWNAPIATEPFTLDDPEQLRRLSDDLRDSRDGILIEASRSGRRVLCAYVPFFEDQREGSAHLIITLPMATVDQAAADARRAVQAQTRAQLATNASILIACVIAAMLLAYFGARHITSPIRSLVDAAASLGRGDFTARAIVRTRDELEDLAETFNTMVPQLREHVRLADSMELARQLQQNLLPASAPSVQGLDVAGWSHYCDETGGDYYDYLLLERDDGFKLGVVIGDVTGHGVGPALLMATARALIRSRAVLPGTVADQMTDVNRYLTRDTIQGRFMTLCTLIFDPGQRRFRWCSAGHDAPIVYLPKEDRFLPEETQDIPLGIDPNWTYSQASVGPLERGALIVVGTDGIWESRNNDGEMFGKDRLRELLRANAHRPASEITTMINDAVDAFRNGNDQEDDITGVVVRFS